MNVGTKEGNCIQMNHFKMCNHFSAVLPKRKLIGLMYTCVGTLPLWFYLICVQLCRVGAMHEIKNPSESLFINSI
jgi:hypothetical protein